VTTDYIPVRKVHRPGTSLLTVQEVATELRVSKMTVYRLIHGGEMDALRVGRSIRVPEKELDKYITHAAESMWTADE
jgi:excisionase family DNA binding protein